MASYLRFAPALTVSALLCACSGGGSSAVPTAPPVQPNNGGALAVGPYTAHFTEYPLPAGETGPADITVGPDGAVWFALDVAIGRITGPGAITVFQPPAFTDHVFTAIASLHNSLWYGVDIIPPEQQPEQFLVQQPLGGSPVTALGLPADSSFSHLQVGPDGKLWFDLNTFEIGQVENSSGTIVPLPANYFANEITAGPDGKLYATAIGEPATPNSVVFQISTSGTILNQFALPQDSFPVGITSGPDGALWIALNGASAIGRLTTTGSFTSFPLPTADAQPWEIISTSDGSLWFTEQHANAIGRITTSGSITEYPVPTPNAGLYGLTSCPQQCENAHGRIWFTERTAAKIGKLEF